MSTLRRSTRRIYAGRVSRDRLLRHYSSAHIKVVHGCSAFGVLLQILRALIDQYIDLRLLDVIDNLAVDAVLTFFAVGRVVRVY